MRDGELETENDRDKDRECERETETENIFMSKTAKRVSDTLSLKIFTNQNVGTIK